MVGPTLPVTKYVVYLKYLVGSTNLGETLAFVSAISWDRK